MVSNSLIVLRRFPNLVHDYRTTDRSGHNTRRAPALPILSISSREAFQKLLESAYMRRAQQLGRYHLLDRIAFGGMAEIYRAKTFDAGGHVHWVAVKRVLAHLAEDEDFIQMLVDEAKIAGQIKHPNVARVYEFTQAHGEYFIDYQNLGFQMSCYRKS